MCQELTVKHLYKIRWNLGILVCAGLMFSVPVWHLIFAPVLRPISWHSVHQSGQKLDMDHFESKPLLGCLSARDSHVKGPPCPWMARAGTCFFSWVHKVFARFARIYSFGWKVLQWQWKLRDSQLIWATVKWLKTTLVLQEFFVRDVRETL